MVGTEAVPRELRPGDDRSPVLLHVPHAGTLVPDRARSHLMLDDAELAAEVAALTDHHTDLLADDPRHRDELLAAYYAPWAAAVRTVVEERLRATGCVVLLDVHSYPSVPLPYERSADGPRPALCLGTDAFHTPTWLTAAARAAFAPIGDVGLDSPFAGTYVPLAHHGTDPRVLSIMIEIRRDGCLDEPGGAPSARAAQVARALADLVDAVTAPPPAGRPPAGTAP